MMQLVTHDLYGEFVDDLPDMYRLRCRVFKDGSVRTCKSAGAWKLTNSMPCILPICCSGGPKIVCRDAYACYPPLAQTCCAIPSPCFGRAPGSGEAEILEE
jgi:hypothetical protein